MKLFEFKTRYMSRLALLKTTSDRERELKDKLINKLNYLRTVNLPRLTHDLYLIIEYEHVSDEFKKICQEMLEEISKIEFVEE